MCYRNIDKQFCEYFDPFGLITQKIYIFTKKWSKIMYSTDEIQERDFHSVLSRY